MKNSTEVCDLNCKKHIKIWKLHLLGISNKEIAVLLQTNKGHVYNVLKDYKNNLDKQVASLAF